MHRRTFFHTLGGSFAVQAIASLPALAQDASASPTAKQAGGAPRFGDGRDWWFERRFGMFVHFGLYAIHGWHEQEQWRGKVPRAEYEKLAQQWNPAQFDADALVKLAEESGMGYICLTTKHHDGFCLWDTKLTRFNTMNTPYGKDIVKQLADACHRRKMPLCLYYSVVDWNQRNHPNKGGEKGSHHEIPPQPGDEPDIAKYMDFLRGQIRELCTHYGEIHGIWWDMNRTRLPKDPSLNAMIRQLQPKAVINDRGFDDGDFGTPERDYSSHGDDTKAFTKRIEACQAITAASWGYNPNDDVYTARYIEESIVRYLARDANYLLNVGPAADGTVPANQKEILGRVGHWFRAMREAVQGTVLVSQQVANRDVMVTRKDQTLYVILHKNPKSDGVNLQPLNVTPKRATLLNTGQAVKTVVDLSPSHHASGKSYLRVRELPVHTCADEVMVVKLEFDQLPAAFDTPQTSNANDVNIR